MTCTCTRCTTGLQQQLAGATRLAVEMCMQMGTFTRCTRGRQCLQQFSKSSFPSSSKDSASQTPLESLPAFTPHTTFTSPAVRCRRL